MPRTGIWPPQMRGIGPRGVVVVDGVGTAREDDRLGRPALDLGPGRVVRQELRVDVQLPNATGDQLGELAAEVEDDDRVGLDRSVVVRSIGRWRLERRLEVGLYLRVIGGEDSVAGVRRLAVDGLAASVPSSRGLAPGAAAIPLRSPPNSPPSLPPLRLTPVYGRRRRLGRRRFSRDCASRRQPSRSRRASRAATSGGGATDAMAARMWLSQASRSAGPIANGA